MARPVKQGLDFYKKDIGFYEDLGIFSLMSEYGPLGVTVYEIILTMIYREGYFIEAPVGIVARRVARVLGKWGSNVDKIERIILFCAESDLFHRDLLRSGVITSQSIQQRYSEITSRSKADKSRYWLIDSENCLGEPCESMPGNRVSAAETPVFAAKTPVIAAETQQEVRERSKSKIADLNPQSYERREEREKEDSKTGGCAWGRAAVFIGEEMRNRNEECGIKNEGEQSSDYIGHTRPFGAPSPTRGEGEEQMRNEKEEECEMKNEQTAEKLTAQQEEERMVRETLESIENKAARDLLAQLYINIKRNGA